MDNILKLKHTWIYWKWKEGRTYSESFVQKIIETKDDYLIELNDSEIYSAYPTRILISEIVILDVILDIKPLLNTNNQL